MGKNDLLIYGGAAVLVLVWYFKFNGKSTIDNLLGDLKGGGSQVNTGSNVFGDDMDIPSVDNINSQVRDMINKAKSRTGAWTDERGNNFNNQSGQNRQINRQSNVGTGGKIVQTQSHSQHSDVRYTTLAAFENFNKLGNLM